MKKQIKKMILKGYKDREIIKILLGERPDYKEIIEKAIDLEWLFKNHAQNFNNEEIKLAFEKSNAKEIHILLKKIPKYDKELVEFLFKNVDKLDGYNIIVKFDRLYSYLVNKIDKETIKYILDKDIFLWIFFQVFENSLDKDIISYALEIECSALGVLYKTQKENFDKELIKKAIQTNEELDLLYKFNIKKFDKELIEYAIKNDKKYIEALYVYASPEQKKIFKEIKKEIVKKEKMKN